MKLAEGVSKLFDRLGIVHLNRTEILSMSEEQLIALLQERHVPVSFAEWFSLEPSDLDAVKLEAYNQLKPLVDRFILSCSEQIMGDSTGTRDVPFTE